VEAGRDLRDTADRVRCGESAKSNGEEFAKDGSQDHNYRESRQGPYPTHHHHRYKSLSISDRRKSQERRCRTSNEHILNDTPNERTRIPRISLKDTPKSLHIPILYIYIMPDIRFYILR